MNQSMLFIVGSEDGPLRTNLYLGLWGTIKPESTRLSICRILKFVKERHKLLHHPPGGYSDQVYGRIWRI